MITATQSAETQNLFNQWWHHSGNLVLELAPECRQVWLESISEVIRYYRLTRLQANEADKKLYASLCRVSLAKTRAELMNFLVSGYVPLAQMQQLHRLEAALEETLE
jgi:hypothetical protein